MLALLPGSLFATNTQQPKKKPKRLPNTGEFFRFEDPTTETPVVRLTNPATNSFLPGPANRFVSLKERFLVFSSDRTGKLAPFQMDMGTGVRHQLADTANLLPSSLCLDESERVLYLIDENRLQEITLTTKKVRTLAEDVSAFSASAAPSQFVVVRRGRLERLDGNGGPLAEGVGSYCLVRPKANGCLFIRELSGVEREFWYARMTSTAGADPVLVAKGSVSNPYWSPDGQSLLFLRNVPGPGVTLSEIHEVIPDTGAERCIAPTTQFAAFAPNGDGSVFVGASRSKAQPNVVLLLRSAQRELTLCEHRATHPASVSPVFSPDSRRVYFQSDHEGKSALYTVNVELLVEPTAPNAE
jgi:oligogalacturonide lyase